MGLFEHALSQQRMHTMPLAARMRPRTFDEFIGQTHLAGKNRALRRVIESDQIPSLLFWGPPGSGKTTLAQLIASITKCHFEALSAVTTGVAELRAIIQAARERLTLYQSQTILFVDEIHRFNKAQQDVLLPHIENGTIRFIGATTENPSFEVIAPLLSRSRVFVLYRLNRTEVGLILTQALGDRERGLGKLNLELETKAATHLANMADGDARIALNALEFAAYATSTAGDETRIISLETVEDVMQQRIPLYDKTGDNHYDTISAFIKSVRGSDPNGAIYWLSRMLEAGENPMFIARRIIILAAEDIGLADPGALSIATSAQQALHVIGMPEGAIPLAEAVLYLATAPKSNAAYLALTAAREDAKQALNEPIPNHLRNPVTRLAQQLEHGKSYRYPHNFPGHFEPAQYLPDLLKDQVYYKPTDQGYERDIAKRIKDWWGSSLRPLDASLEVPEIDSPSEVDDLSAK